MFDRISNGWEIAKASWQVLLKDKEMLVFPLCSGLAMLLVLGSFALPLAGTAYADVVTGDRDVTSDPVAWLILFAFYFVNYFVITFFNAGLVACAIIRLQGGDPTLADGFRASLARLPQILGWALLAASVGVLLRVLESRSKSVGGIVTSLLGTAWSILTFFIVPILVVERLGPFAAVKRSARIMRDTWGEAFVANFSVGLIAFPLFLLFVIAPVLLAIFLIQNTAVTVACIIFAILAGLLIALASSAVDGIAKAAVYVYGTQGRNPLPLSNAYLQGAFS